MEDVPCSPARDSERIVDLDGLKMFTFYKETDFLNQTMISFNENKNKECSFLNKTGPIFKPNFKIISTHQFIEEEPIERSIFNQNFLPEKEKVSLDENQKKLIFYIFHHDFEEIKKKFSGSL